MAGWPDLNQFVNEAWGWSDECIGPSVAFSNIASGQNPPWTLSDLLTTNPKFLGSATPLANATLTSGSATVTVASTTGLAAGQFLTGPGIPSGTLIQSVSTDSFTLTSPASADGTVTLSVYQSPFVPIPLLLLYIGLASASLIQTRWQATWYLAMGLYVAHFATLWLWSDGNPSSTPGQAAAAGMARGILVAKSGDSLSGSYQVTSGLEDWGSWQETQYGKQLATFARVIGSGPMLIW